MESGMPYRALFDGPILQRSCVWSVSSEQALDRAGCLYSVDHPTVYGVISHFNSNSTETLNHHNSYSCIEYRTLFFCLWVKLGICFHLNGQAVEWSCGEMIQVLWKILSLVFRTLWISLNCTLVFEKMGRLIYGAEELVVLFNAPI
jgi:hypothetical protein